jgi:MbtH protein
MSNPFEDSENGTFLVLVNEEGQHSLWPTFIDVPAGWQVAHPADSHRACQDYIEEHWTDMRPKSLTDSLG